MPKVSGVVSFRPALSIIRTTMFRLVYLANYAAGRQMRPPRPTSNHSTMPPVELFRRSGSPQRRRGSAQAHLILEPLLQEVEGRLCDLAAKRKQEGLQFLPCLDPTLLRR